MSLLYDQFDRDDPYLFAEACQRNDVMGIRELLQHEPYNYPANVNSHVDSRFGEEIAGYTPLHFAVMYTRKDPLIYLLQQGADITKKSANSQTPVHLAFSDLDRDSVSTIFKHSQINTYINAVDNTGLTHFHICCALSVPAVIEKFITNGVEVNCPVPSLADEYSGFTPLHFAVKYKNNDALIYLLQQGADISKQNADFLTPVHLAYYNSDNDLISTIFEYSQINTCINAVDRTGLTHLHICCALGVPDAIIERFIKNGANIHCLVSLFADKNSGFTPLHFAAQNGHTSTVKLLLENGANLQMKCSKGFTPLHVACQNTSLPVIELLLTHDADLNTLRTKDKEGRTALHYAVEKRIVSIVELLVERGASIRKPDNKNQTPFDVAVKSRQYEVVEAMLPQCKNEDGTPISFSTIFNLDDFHEVCKQGNLKDIKSFLNQGFSVNSHASSNTGIQFRGYTPLHFAVENDCLDVIIELLQNGADITRKNDHGQTPVHLAYQNIFNDHILHMFKHSKNNTYVNVANESGLSHFHICCTFNAPDIIEGFIKHGVDVNIQTLSLSNSTESGFTPLHYAIKSGLPSIVELLLKNGANPFVRCADFSSTPLHLVCEYDDNPTVQLAIAQLLLEYGADIMARDDQKRLPLHRAFYTNPDTPLTGFLLEKIPKDYNYADNQRLSVLHIACFRRKKEIVERLLDGGCCPNDRVTLNKRYSNLIFAKGKLFSGVTPLHIALYVKDATIVEQLLLAGADINATDDKGSSTLEYLYNASNTTYESRFDRDMILTEGLISEHVKKLEAAEAYVRAEIKHEISERYIPRRINDSIINLDACITELVKIQSIKVDGCADGILRSILKKNETEMSWFVRNENLITFLSPEYLDIFVKEFTLYGFMIKSQVNRGLKRVAIVQKAKVSLKSLTGISLPDLCSELIFDYLSNEHLENLIEANVVLQKKD